MNIQAHRKGKAHINNGIKHLTIDGIQAYLPLCATYSNGMHKEPRADEVTCSKCLRKIAKGIQNENLFNQA